jgi:hypothetical protein
MSFEGCFLAFLSRAASAVPVGGMIFTCVHPLARQVFRKVIWALPVQVEEYLAELSAYYYEGFIENWYRSDMVVMRRAAGEPRWATTDAIPLQNIIAGQLADRMHGFTDVRNAPFQRARFDDVHGALEDLLAKLDNKLESHVSMGERYAHYYAALKDGGHVALVMDLKSGAFSYDLYPCTPELEATYSAAFGRVMPLARTITFRREAVELGAAAPRVHRRPRR